MDELDDPRHPRKPRPQRWLVSGRVQGVGFRWFVLRAAERERLEGEVRNLADGRVEVRVQGEPAALARLLEAVRKGPRASRVDDVSVAELNEAIEFEGFRVRH